MKNQSLSLSEKTIRAVDLICEQIAIINWPAQKLALEKANERVFPTLVPKINKKRRVLCGSWGVKPVTA